MNLLKPFTQKHLYIRLAKTGSTSLATVLDKKTISLTPSLKARKKFSNYRYDYRFTIIRNPFDRIVSSYFMVCKSEQGRKMVQATKDLFHADTSLNDFVKRTIEFREQYQQLALEQVDGIYTIPWYDRSKNPDENRKSYEAFWVLSHTLGLKASIDFFLPAAELDFVGRYESLNADYQQIKQSLKLKGDLPHLYSRAEKKVPFQSYYDDATRELVAQMYREDLDVFDYTFA